MNGYVMVDVDGNEVPAVEPGIKDSSIATLERVGLSNAVNSIAELLDSAGGQGKHGDRGWELLPHRILIAKMTRHLAQHMSDEWIDADSGHPAIAAVAVRGLQLCERFVRGVR